MGSSSDEDELINFNSIDQQKAATDVAFAMACPVHHQLMILPAMMPCCAAGAPSWPVPKPSPAPLWEKTFDIGRPAC
jgi:hypothetical protein